MVEFRDVVKKYAGTDEALGVPAGTVGGIPVVSKDSEPGTVYFRSSSAGGPGNQPGDSDSTSRIVFESYQMPEVGPFGESIRFHAKTPQAKTMLAWYTPVDPSQPWDPDTNPMNPKADVWIGSHYAAQNAGQPVHGHVSIEVPDDSGSLHSRFGIDWINQTTKTRGVDKTSTYFSATDVTVRQGSGEVFRLAAGNNERVVEFSVASSSGVSPGDVDPLKRRWWLVADTTPESGGNAGTNFLIRRFDDAGSPAGTALFISRSSGNVTIGEAADQSARLAARFAGGIGILSAPTGTPTSAFAAVLSASTHRGYQTSVSGDSAPRFTVRADGQLAWGSGSDVTDTTLYRAGANILETPGWLSVGNRILLSASNGNGFLEFREQSAAPAAAADRARVYAEDDGNGKTRLVVRFATGAPVVIATEP